MPQNPYVTVTFLRRSCVVGIAGLMGSELCSRRGSAR